MARPADPAAPLPLRKTVRARMLLIALLPILILLPLLLGIATRNWSARFDEVLVAKVNGELTIAHQHLAGLLQSRGAAIEALGQSAALNALQAASGPDQAADLAAFLEVHRQHLGFDFLYFVAAPDAKTLRWPVVQAALAGQQRTAIDIFSAQDLAVL
ncbi:MAG: hypothetical protein U1D35_18675, partial [Paracoccaceae bacterium]|nr:hypothetical protein [Paracoccaceae bacterium]